MRRALQSSLVEWGCYTRSCAIVCLYLLIPLIAILLAMVIPAICRMVGGP